MSSQPAAAVPPSAQLIQMGIAYWTSQLVFVAAQLGLADRLGTGPRTSDDLARELGLDAAAFHRYLRTLAGLGVVTEVDRRVFGLTPLGEALKKDAPGSARASILILGGPVGTRSWGELLYSLQTGKTGFEKLVGKNLFEYLAEHPGEASLFSETMVGFHGAEPPPSRPPTTSRGSGRSSTSAARRGTCSDTILEAPSRPRGVLYDLPHVVRDAPALPQRRAAWPSACTIESGSFFERRAERRHDAYILSHIIHDWDEAQCSTILRKLPASDEARRPAADRRDGAARQATRRTRARCST